MSVYACLPHNILPHHLPTREVLPAPQEEKGAGWLHGGRRAGVQHGAAVLVQPGDMRPVTQAGVGGRAGVGDRTSFLLQVVRHDAGGAIWDLHSWCFWRHPVGSLLTITHFLGINEALTSTSSASSPVLRQTCLQQHLLYMRL